MDNKSSSGDGIKKLIILPQKSSSHTFYLYDSFIEFLGSQRSRFSSDLVVFSDLKKHVFIQHDLTIRPELMIFDIRVHIRFDTGGQQYCKSFVLRQQIRCALSE